MYFFSKFGYLPHVTGDQTPDIVLTRLRYLPLVSHYIDRLNVILIESIIRLI